MGLGPFLSAWGVGSFLSALGFGPRHLGFFFLVCGVFKIDKGGERGKVRDDLGAFSRDEGGSVVGLVASAVRLRWLGVTGVWCICEFKIDKGGETGKVRDDLRAFLESRRGFGGGLGSFGGSLTVAGRHWCVVYL